MDGGRRGLSDFGTGVRALPAAALRQIWSRWAWGYVSTGVRGASIGGSRLNLACSPRFALGAHSLHSSNSGGSSAMIFAHSIPYRSWVVSIC